jgi:hypothetical protein
LSAKKSADGDSDALDSEEEVVKGGTQAHIREIARNWSPMRTFSVDTDGSNEDLNSVLDPE